MDTTNKKELIIKILNVFENDSGSPATEYDKIYLYKDGPNKTRQVTLGRGYTEAGSLWKVFEAYKELGGDKADALLDYRKFKGKQTLPKDKKFLELIIQCAKNDPLFRSAQDRVFDELYWNPAFKYFTSSGFTLPLSLAVIQDSKLHSGGMLKFLTNSFPEKRPFQGGDEKEWITAYVYARYNWLVNASDLLNNTIYRPLFFIQRIKANDWDLTPPFTANGVKIKM